MVPTRPSDSFYDPGKGHRAVRSQPVALEHGPFEPPRTNCFSVYWIESGRGTFWADSARHRFGPWSLLFFVPYQHVRFAPDEPVRGDVIQFHANFLCVETFHAEVGCSGTLFNDPYGTPAVSIDGPTRDDVTHLVGRIRREHEERGLAHQEALLAYVKVLLIQASDGGFNRAARINSTLT